MALEELLKLPARSQNPYVSPKEKDRYVIGYVCSYVPEEVIWACGMLPYRVEARGCTETALADIYFHRFNCIWARSILQLGLSGEYDFLDGFCFLNGCEQVRRLYEVWERKVRAKEELAPKFMAMIAIPHNTTEAGLEWYKEEISNFKEGMKGYFGVGCSDEALRDAIKVYNETRRLMAELYDLRKAENPPINGADAFKLTLAAYTMPRNIYNALLKEALNEIRQRKGISDYRARVMVGGSALDDPSFIELIESVGGLVVTDCLCFASKVLFDLVEEDGDPLDALAKRYYYHNPCPRMLGQYPRRLQFVEDCVKAAKVDGVIFNKLSFCDYHGVDGNMMVKDLQAKGIPAMQLEKEYALTDIGRLRTRVEAFVERIERR